jgi:putative Mn2+ efflux pump MntP
MMHFSLVVAGLLLGLDSFLVSVPLGATPLGASHRRWLALAFAVCDGLASFLGWFGGMAEWRTSLLFGDWLGPVAVGSYGIYVLALAWHSRRLANASRGSWLAIGLPLCLSLDNLAAGVGADGTAAGSAALAALATGAASGCLALVGMGLGAALTKRIRLRAQWLGGAALVAVALILLCKEALP